MKTTKNSYVQAWVHHSLVLWPSQFKGSLRAPCLAYFGLPSWAPKGLMGPSVPSRRQNHVFTIPCITNLSVFGSLRHLEQCTKSEPGKASKTLSQTEHVTHMSGSATKQSNDQTITENSRKNVQQTLGCQQIAIETQFKSLQSRQNICRSLGEFHL